MRVPLSWVMDFVDIDIPLDELAERLTMHTFEVDEVHLVGMMVPEGAHMSKITGLGWEPDKIVVAQVNEVMPHPNADRLVLCKLNDGTRDHIVLTGAPNLYPYKGIGPLETPIKVAYAKEGALLYDGHKEGLELTRLKPAKIRGVESYSMICSEKELGISDEHEGIMMLPEDAPTGMPLTDYMGDAVLDISILPNMARNLSIIGVAREIAALLGKPLKHTKPVLRGTGPNIAGRAFLDIKDPALNPRFVVGLIEGVEPRPSPEVVQRRLKLAGMRPINSIVDATNYVMLETGQPLHAFDYDVLVKRAGGNPPTIITRAAQPGETLVTLDHVERKLDDQAILVTDTAGILSLAGVMGGLESEVTAETRNVLLEGANWNLINIRKTASALRLASEAGYRFARGVHPALSEEGVIVGLQRMADWSGGEIASGLVDSYPGKVEDPEVTLTNADVERMLGISLPLGEICRLLTPLGFECTELPNAVVVKTPPTRLDIGTGVIGKADVLEEVVRLYGYHRIPERRLADELPKQKDRVDVLYEQRLQDILVDLGMQEILTYRLTSPERELKAMLTTMTAAEVPYVRLQNPIAPERSVMRRSMLPAMLEVVERNHRLNDHLALFEIGPVFLPHPGQQLPDEPHRVGLVMTGKRQAIFWKNGERQAMDFFDLKGVIEDMTAMLHVTDVTYVATEHPSFHPGKCAQVLINGHPIGVMGELHPVVKERYDLGPAPLLAAELDLALIFAAIPPRHSLKPTPSYPPVLEDLAIVVDENVNAESVEAVIRKAGGALLDDLQLFDIFRGSQLGEGKKSLAYNLTYLSPDHTMTDQEIKGVRNRIISQLERDLGAVLRS